MTNYNTNHGLIENSIEIIYKDKNGELWFCSGMNAQGYVYKFNGESFDRI